MKVTFILPHVGRKADGKQYVRSWQMEPLPIATLMGLTPEDIETNFFDERIEDIHFDEETDLVGINVETYTAKRAYEIANAFRKRGVKVVLGGYHVMLMPQEASLYADAILCGYAEGVWPRLLRDAEKGNLKPRYNGIPVHEIQFSLPNRTVLKEKPYFGPSAVETGRGCPFSCDFCSISTVTRSHFVARPIDMVVEDIASLKKKFIFFVDDNIVGDFPHTKELLRELIPLKIKWISQGSLNMAKDDELLSLMAQSGCLGILVGFESLQHKSLMLMNKKFMMALGDMKQSIAKLHSHGMGIYGTFIFGYETDAKDDFLKTVDFAVEQGIFIGAFNHLVPFPNTQLYKRLEYEKRLVSDAWWLEPNFRFNDVPFYPKHTSREQVKSVCLDARKRFFSFPSIVKRGKNVSGNLNSFTKAGAFFVTNFLLRKEIVEKHGIPLGNENMRPVPYTGA